MQMTVSEIRKNYMEAKYKKRQIGILADLNCCSKKDIEKILEAPEGVTMLDITISSAREALYKKLDELEVAIQRMEQEYRNVVMKLRELGSVDGS